MRPHSDNILFTLSVAKAHLASRLYTRKSKKHLKDAALLKNLAR